MKFFDMIFNRRKFATQKNMDRYKKYLQNKELAKSTIEKYMRIIQILAAFLGGKPITKEAAIEWKKNMKKTHAPTSVNFMIVVANGFFRFLGLNIKLKEIDIPLLSFAIDNRLFADGEVKKLLAAAKNKKSKRLYHIIQTLISTGIRVTELRFITVEALKKGEALIANKGRARMVYLKKPLREELLGYAGGRGITSGCVFVTRSGKCVDRSNIWREIQNLCEAAEVEATKGHPHNFRRHFAAEFHRESRDIVKLAMLLGHVDIRTTMGYIRQIEAEIRQTMEAMEFMS